MTLAPPAAQVVGRILDPATLPGGAALLMKAARKAGGWHVWATRAEVLRPVKVTAAKDSADGVAVYADRPFDRVLVKGKHHSGRRFVVQYLGGKTVSAYVRTRAHTCFVPGSLLSLSDTSVSTDPTPHSWTTPTPMWRSASVTTVKAYLADEGQP